MIRREFLKNAALASFLPFISVKNKIEIASVASGFEREALFPYRFKGSAITESWQVVSGLESSTGTRKIGLCTQGVLWSDARVFLKRSESAANALMYAVTDFALQKLKGKSFTHPILLLEELIPEVLEYAKEITEEPNLRTTFALNALVSIDNAAWLLFAHENGLSTFDELIPKDLYQGTSARHSKVASIPSFATGTAISVIEEALKKGHFMLKLKTGAPGTQEEMLNKDIAFMKELHKRVGHLETEYTKNGKIPYYFDMNGRYQKMEYLVRFLEEADKVGALEQIAIIEEPFPEELKVSVKHLPVTVAADESAHTVKDVEERIALGYGAVVVKAVAKTLSMTLKMAQKAAENNIPCFCADLTVNPILVDWNKLVASRLPSFDNLNMGLLEANGHQYYKDWSKLESYHPQANANWYKVRNGLFDTGKEFQNANGGIFETSKHYFDLLQWPKG